MTRLTSMAREPVSAVLRCEPMTHATRAEALALLGTFLGTDAHYAASSGAYGDAGEPALVRALDLFLEHPDAGCVWLALDRDCAIGACVVSYAISTSRGSFVAKLDDVTVAQQAQGRGVGTAMLSALARWLAARGVTRIDSSCHRANTDAW